MFGLISCRGGKIPWIMAMAFLQLCHGTELLSPLKHQNVFFAASTRHRILLSVPEGPGIQAGMPM